MSPDSVPSPVVTLPEDDHVAGQVFDVEPPYLPDHDAVAAVEEYDGRFLDRELSWLHFNQRVLELAEDPNRFLSTVQVGITLVGTLAGVFGGATLGQVDGFAAEAARLRQPTLIQVAHDHDGGAEQVGARRRCQAHRARTGDVDR